MGYTVNGGGSFRIQDGRETDALAALKTWAAGIDHVGYANDGHLAAVETVAAFWAELLPDADPDPDGTIYVSSDDSWSEHYDQAAHVVGPFVAEGGICEWQGEEGEHWRWRFDGTECHEEFARLVYGDETDA